jgi:hypothetical protein
MTPENETKLLDLMRELLSNQTEIIKLLQYATPRIIYYPQYANPYPWEPTITWTSGGTAGTNVDPTK